MQCVLLPGPPNVKRDLETDLLRSKRDLDARVSSGNLPTDTAYLVPLLGSGPAGEGDDDVDAAQLLLARHAVSLDAARLKHCGPPVPDAGQK